MKNSPYGWFVGFCIACTTVNAQLILPIEPTINATGFVLMDAATKEVLIENNSDERLPPASLTKIMTSYVAASELASGTISLNDEVPISENAWRAIGSRMFINPNSTVPLIDLLRGIVIQSGNDASVAVAEYIAGSEEQFAKMMNATADLIGLENTNFANSTGLPNDNQYVTARDVALLSEALIRNFPEHYKLYSELEFEYNEIKQPNRNRMLTLDSSVDGVKTGYTDAAGYCLAVSAKRDGMRLISVVMGAASSTARETETRKLLQYGFRHYQTKTLYEELQEVSEARVWYASVEKFKIGVGETFRKTMLKTLIKDVSHELKLPETFEAPIERGQQVGEMVVSANDEEIGRLPLIALVEVPEAGFFKRIWDSIQLSLESAGSTTIPNEQE